jgi:Epoxide hydrolase N terminus
LFKKSSDMHNGRAESQITPSRLDIPRADLNELRDRRAQTRWPSPGPGDDWDLGVPVACVRGLAECSRDGNDWRRDERPKHIVVREPEAAKGTRAPIDEALASGSTSGSRHGAAVCSRSRLPSRPGSDRKRATEGIS